MPCNLTVQKRKLIRQLIGISDAFRCSATLFDKFYGRQAENGIHRQEINRRFSRIRFFVKSQQFFRVFSILFLQHLHGLFSWNAVFSRNSRTEIKLAQCCSDQKRDCLRMLRKAMLHRIAQIFFSDMRHISYITACCRNSRRGLQIGFGKLCIGNRLQFFHLVFRKTKFFQHSCHNLSAILFFRIPLEPVHAALNDPFMEKTVCLRHLHERPDLCPAAGLTENGHIVRISAKAANIVMYPLKRRNDIQISCIGRGFILFSKGREIEITKHIQPVVQRHYDYISVFCHIGTFICDMFNRGTGRKTASVEPDHNRTFCFRIDRRRPDIQ